MKKGEKRARQRERQVVGIGREHHAQTTSPTRRSRSYEGAMTAADTAAHEHRWEIRRAGPLEYHEDDPPEQLHEATIWQGDLFRRGMVDETGYPVMTHKALTRISRGQSLPRPRSYLTIPEVARLLEVHPQTIRDAIERGSLRAYRPGGPSGTGRVHTGELERYLAANGYTSEAIGELRTTWQAWLAPTQQTETA